jgi:hypothetical protein
MSEDDVDEWVEVAGNLRFHSFNVDGGDELTAQRAIANLLSAYGYQNAPFPVLEMFAHLLEVGYLTALRDVRNGGFDDELAMWRPDICR